MRVIHWTSNKNFKLKPIYIQNGYEGDGLPAKPLGGLWCSPLNSKRSWEDWCKAEDFCNLDEYFTVIFDITKEGMLIINSKEDLSKLPLIKPRNLEIGYNINITYIDFRSLLKGGCKSIWLTQKGVWDTKFDYPIGLYSWDCETVLIMDNNIITYYEIKSKQINN